MVERIDSCKFSSRCACTRINQEERKEGRKEGNRMDDLTPARDASNINCGPHPILISTGMPHAWQQWVQWIGHCMDELILPGSWADSQCGLSTPTTVPSSHFCCKLQTTGMPNALHSIILRVVYAHTCTYIHTQAYGNHTGQARLGQNRENSRAPGVWLPSEPSHS